MKNLTTLQKGIYLALGTAVISGFANFFNKFGLQAVAKDAYQYTTLKNIVVALILSIVILSPLIWSKLKGLKRKDWFKLIIIGLVGGSFPFLLFFKGLSMTSAVNASFIHKTLFLWVAILAWPILKEKLSKLQFLALGLLLVGNIIFGGLKSLSWGDAETIILIATILWAIENIIAKITLKNLDSIVVAWGRMFFGSIILIGFLAITNNTSGILNLSLNQLGWIILVSIFLTGYVTSWYSALKYAPVTVVTCILVLASPITTMLNSIFVIHKYSWLQVVGSLIILGAIGLFWHSLLKFKRITRFISHFHKGAN